MLCYSYYYRDYYAAFLYHYYYHSHNQPHYYHYHTSYHNYTLYRRRYMFPVANLNSCRSTSSPSSLTAPSAGNTIAQKV